MPAYQQRGDEQIWLLHPYDRTLTVYRRLPNGGYHQSVHSGSLIAPVTLPGVEIDLDTLFD